MFNAPLTFSSKLIKGSFRNAAFRLNKPAIVFEAGESMRFDNFSIQQGISGILRVFESLEMFFDSIGNDKKGNESICLERLMWLRAPTAGIFVPQVLNDAKVEKDTLLGIVSDTYAQKTKQITSPFDGYIICLNYQAVVNQGDALFYILERFSFKVAYYCSPLVFPNSRQ
ncbi:MAG: putative deacylase [Maribacter sp.]|jgi:predicted deacylase